VTTPKRSAVIRVVLAGNETSHGSGLEHALEMERDILVVGRPANAAEAVSLVAGLRPDVVILDLQHSQGASQHAIELIMADTPTPILLLATPSESRESPAVIEALVAGALDVQPRPSCWTPEHGARLRRAVRQLSQVHVIRHPRGGTTHGGRDETVPSPTQQPVVAIAASTGGPSALATLLAGLGGLAAPVLIVQHLHPDFTDGLVGWMSRVCPLPVSTAVHHQTARPGRVYFAPGGLHLRIGARLRLELGDQPASTHRPSANELFASMAERVGSAAIGVVLTGMGDDGAAGLLAIHRRGGRTLAQDEATSAVFGMPKAAERLGAVAGLLPVTKLAAGIQRAVRELQT
jgi:two-component system chemotaxis response regulator CheB